MTQYNLIQGIFSEVEKLVLFSEFIELSQRNKYHECIEKLRMSLSSLIQRSKSSQRQINEINENIKKKKKQSRKLSNQVQTCYNKLTRVQEQKQKLQVSNKKQVYRLMHKISSLQDKIKWERQKEHFSTNIQCEIIKASTLISLEEDNLFLEKKVNSLRHLNDQLTQQSHNKQLLIDSLVADLEDKLQNEAMDQQKSQSSTIQEDSQEWSSKVVNLSGYLSEDNTERLSGDMFQLSIEESLSWKEKILEILGKLFIILQ